MALFKRCRCGKKINYMSTYCDSCKKEKGKENKERVKRYDKEIRRNAHNLKYAKFYNSKPWKVLSSQIKHQYNGMCAMCLYAGIISDSDVTHHIVEIKEDYEKRLDEDNLIPLCHACHNELDINYTEQKKEMLREIMQYLKKELLI